MSSGPLSLGFSSHGEWEWDGFAESLGSTASTEVWSIFRCTGGQESPQIPGYKALGHFCSVTNVKLVVKGKEEWLNCHDADVTLKVPQFL